eukprot:5741169-Pleurochrysis_carterae.AAC.4
MAAATPKKLAEPPTYVAAKHAAAHAASARLHSLNRTLSWKAHMAPTTLPTAPIANAASVGASSSFGCLAAPPPRFGNTSPAAAVERSFAMSLAPFSAFSVLLAFSASCCGSGASRLVATARGSAHAAAAS